MSLCFDECHIKNSSIVEFIMKYILQKIFITLLALNATALHCTQEVEDCAHTVENEVKDKNTKPQWSLLLQEYASSLVASGVIGAATGGLTAYWQYQIIPRSRFLSQPLISQIRFILEWWIELYVRESLVAETQNDFDRYHVPHKKWFMPWTAWLASWIAYLRMAA